MKNILLKFYSFCFLLVIVSFFSACSDDKITMPAGWKYLFGKSRTEAHQYLFRFGFAC